MDQSTSTAQLPGEALPGEARRFGHVCGFFHSQQEGYRVLLPVTKEGFERGEKVFHIVDRNHRPERMRRLEDVGVSPAAARRPGRIEIRAWEDAHLRGGRFDKEAMMAMREETLSGAKADGFGQTRVWANMDVLRTHPLLILEGILQENPFFVPPDEVLRELRARDGSDPQN